MTLIKKSAIVSQKSYDSTFLSEFKNVKDSTGDF